MFYSVKEENYHYNLLFTLPIFTTIEVALGSSTVYFTNIGEGNDIYVIN